MFDIHDRRSIFQPYSHDLNTEAHNVVGGSGQIVFRLVGDNNIFGPSTGGRDAATGGDSFVAGDGAGASLTTGPANRGRNILIGLLAGASMTEAHAVAGLGPLVLFSLITGNNIVAAGDADLFSLLDGEDIFSALGAGFQLEGGEDLILIGPGAGTGGVGAVVKHCIALLSGSLINVTTAEHDIGAGVGTLASLTEGKYNLALIAGALDNITIGDGSLGLGKDSGANFLTSTANCGAFGNESGPATAAVYIGEFYFDTHATDTPLFHLDTVTHIATVYGDLDVTGDHDVGGTLTKAAGSFQIEHPLDPERILKHGFIEGPQYGLRYYGKTKLENGKATVNIDESAGMAPGTFESIARGGLLRAWSLSGFGAMWAQELKGAEFGIIAQDGNSTDEVGWTLDAERCDPFVMQSKHTDENGSLILELDKPIRRI